MKKFLSVLLVSILISSPALFAQTASHSEQTLNNLDYKWEVYGGYGYVSLNSFFMMLGFIFAAPAVAIVKDVVDDDDDSLDFSDSGIFNAGINYYFGDHLYAGLTGTYQRFNFLGLSDIWFASIMPEAGVQYGWSRFKFYQSMAFGLWLIGDGRGVNSSYAFNVTWLGMKVRPTDRLWIYAESNFGQKGLIQAGIRYRL